MSTNPSATNTRPTATPCLNPPPAQPDPGGACGQEAGPHTRLLENPGGGGHPRFATKTAAEIARHVMAGGEPYTQIVGNAKDGYRLLEEDRQDPAANAERLGMANALQWLADACSADTLRRVLEDLKAEDAGEDLDLFDELDAVTTSLENIMADPATAAVMDEGDRVGRALLAGHARDLINRVKNHAARPRATAAPDLLASAPEAYGLDASAEADPVAETGDASLSGFPAHFFSKEPFILDCGSHTPGHDSKTVEEIARALIEATLHSESFERLETVFDGSYHRILLQGDGTQTPETVQALMEIAIAAENLFGHLPDSSVAEIARLIEEDAQEKTEGDADA